jgi:hypothetical protein
MYGNEVYYIPRTLVSKDDILGEDRLSEFKTAFPIEMYFENIDNFAGQGAFIQKFGLMVEQSATLVVARRRWDQFVGRYEVSILPHRPAEGDLIYFPLSKGLFEVKFVQHQDPFYQLGKLYVYKLQVELFQYSSERIDTGIAAVDNFETLKSFSTNITRTESGRIVDINVTNQGSGYTTVPEVTITGGGAYGASAVAILGTDSNLGKVVRIDIVNPGTGYNSTPTITVGLPTSGVRATAVAVVEADIDKVESFGDNNNFKSQAEDILFSVTNPFGEIDISLAPTVIPPAATYLKTADSTIFTADNSTTVDVG